MDVDDYLDPKVGVAVAATAMLFSPRVRQALHQSAVYGLAGVFAAGDAVTAFARGVGSGARRVREDREHQIEVVDEHVDLTPYEERGAAEPTERGSTARTRRRTSHEPAERGQRE